MEYDQLPNLPIDMFHSVHLSLPILLEEDREKLLQIENHLQKTKYWQIGEERAWLSEETLHRFLIARQMNVPHAIEMIESALEWRSLRKPSTLQATDKMLQYEGSTGKIYVANMDRWGRPILIFDNSANNSKDEDGQMLYLAFNLERTQRMLLRSRYDIASSNCNGVTENKVYSFSPKIMSTPTTPTTDIHPNIPLALSKNVVFMHMNNFSLFNSPSLRVTKETIKILTISYPETLGHCIIYQPPRIFKMFFDGVKGFIDPKTVSKIYFIIGDCSPGTRNHEILSTVIGENWKDLTGVGKPRTGGKNISPGFDKDVYWKNVVEEENIDNQLKEFLAKNNSETSNHITVIEKGSITQVNNRNYRQEAAASPRKMSGYSSNENATLQAVKEGFESDIVFTNQPKNNINNSYENLTCITANADDKIVSDNPSELAKESMAKINSSLSLVQASPSTLRSVSPASLVRYYWRGEVHVDQKHDIDVPVTHKKSFHNLQSNGGNTGNLNDIALQKSHAFSGQDGVLQGRATEVRVETSLSSFVKDGQEPPLIKENLSSFGQNDNHAKQYCDVYQNKSSGKIDIKESKPDLDNFRFQLLKPSLWFSFVVTMIFLFMITLFSISFTFSIISQCKSNEDLSSLSWLSKNSWVCQLFESSIVESRLQEHHQRLVTYLSTDIPDYLSKVFVVDLKHHQMNFFSNDWIEMCQGKFDTYVNTSYPIRSGYRNVKLAIERVNKFDYTCWAQNITKIGRAKLSFSFSDLCFTVYYRYRMFEKEGIDFISFYSLAQPVFKPFYHLNDQGNYNEIFKWDETDFSITGNCYNSLSPPSTEVDGAIESQSNSNCQNVAQIYCQLVGYNVSASICHSFSENEALAVNFLKLSTKYLTASMVRVLLLAIDFVAFLLTAAFRYSPKILVNHLIQDLLTVSAIGSTLLNCLEKLTTNFSPLILKMLLQAETGNSNFLWNEIVLLLLFSIFALILITTYPSPTFNFLGALSNMISPIYRKYLNLKKQSTKNFIVKKQKTEAYLMLNRSNFEEILSQGKRKL